MGSFSIWHWLIVLIIFVIPVCIGLFVWLIIRATSKPSSTSAPTVAPGIGAPSHLSAEARLQELSTLRSKGLITDSEYDQQRSAVLRSV